MLGRFPLVLRNVCKKGVTEGHNVCIRAPTGPIRRVVASEIITCLLFSQADFLFGAFVGIITLTFPTIILHNYGLVRCWQGLLKHL